MIKVNGMELRITLGYDQIVQLVQQLPVGEKQRLTQALEQELHIDTIMPSSASGELTDLQQLLLHGPVMSDEQFTHFQELRRDFTARLNQ